MRIFRGEQDLEHVGLVTISIGDGRKISIQSLLLFQGYYQIVSLDQVSDRSIL